MYVSVGLYGTRECIKKHLNANYFVYVYIYNTVYRTLWVNAALQLSFRGNIILFDEVQKTIKL